MNNPQVGEIWKASNKSGYTEYVLITSINTNYIKGKIKELNLNLSNDNCVSGVCLLSTKREKIGHASFMYSVLYHTGWELSSEEELKKALKDFLL